MKSPLLIFLPAATCALVVFAFVQPDTPEAAWVLEEQKMTPRIIDDRKKDMRNEDSLEQSHVENTPVRQPEFTREELVKRAQLVEWQANKELERLIPLLDLTLEQQDKVFTLLARNSSAFVPGMRLSSGPVTQEISHPAALESGSTKDEIYEELTEEQKEEMLEDEVDKIAWWDDVIQYIERTVEAPEVVIDGEEAPEIIKRVIPTEPRPEVIENPFIPGSIPF
jgi:hypothetical protein